MATQTEINALTDVFIKVFGKDVALIEEALTQIKLNTEKVTIDNQVATIRKEIAVFIETKEAEIQALLDM